MKGPATVGHGARTIEEFVSILLEAGVEVLVDARRFPASRRHPHFSREALDESLSAAGVRYEWWGEIFGGRRNPVAGSRHHAWRNASFRAYADHMDSEGFRSALKDLEERSGSELQAIMCAETLWWRCHRRLIADALVADGYTVIHLGMGQNDEHRLSEFARLDDRGFLVYDVGVDRPLDL